MVQSHSCYLYTIPQAPKILGQNPPLSSSRSDSRNLLGNSKFDLFGTFLRTAARIVATELFQSRAVGQGSGRFSLDSQERVRLIRVVRKLVFPIPDGFMLQDFGSEVHPSRRNFSSKCQGSTFVPGWCLRVPRQASGVTPFLAFGRCE